MRTKLNLTFGVILFTLLFSCQKEASQELKQESFNSVESAVSATMGNTTLRITPLECGRYLVEADKNGSGQDLFLYVNGDLVAEHSGEPGAHHNISKVFTYDANTTHTIMASYKNLPSQSPELTIDVPNYSCPEDIEECDGSVSLDATAVTLPSVCGQSYTVEYTVESCTNQTGLKLQGGLTANVQAITEIGVRNGESATYVPNAQKKNANSIHTWVFDLEANKPKIFYISFTVSSKAYSGVGINGRYPITGEWSVKKNSTNLAVYHRRIMVPNCK